MNVRGMQIMNGSGFGGTVLSVGNPADEAHRILERVNAAAPAVAGDMPAESKALPDPVFDALANLAPKDAERKAERDALISLSVERNERARVLIEFVLLERQGDLKKEHASIRESGRAQEQVLGALMRELADANMEKNRLEGVFKRTLFDYENAKSEKKDLGRFATDAQLEKANKKIAACSGRVEAAQFEHARSGEYLNSLTLQKIPPEKKKLEEIILELKRVENALAIFPRV
jgi:hypothetical protein